MATLAPSSEHVHYPYDSPWVVEVAIKWSPCTLLLLLLPRSADVLGERQKSDRCDRTHCRLGQSADLRMKGILLLSLFRSIDPPHQSIYSARQSSKQSLNLVDLSRTLITWTLGWVRWKLTFNATWDFTKTMFILINLILHLCQIKHTFVNHVTSCTV